jgi:NAD(P)-dependent dehydrogenase (short-subunit alcohol dehydrogenase family)
VRSFEQVEAAFAQAAAHFGGIDIVVSGAAGNFVAPAAAMSANGFRTVVDIDLNGTFNVFRASLPHLRPNASLLAISAGQAVHPTPFQAHVCAAKAGINQLVRVLAQEWGPEGIRVNGLSPGPVAGTEGMARLAPTEAAQDAVKRRVPLGRYASIAEIADAAVYLCSDAAAYVTGTILDIDGGPLLSGSLRDPAHGLA